MTFGSIVRSVPMTHRAIDGAAALAQFFAGVETLPGLLAKRAALTPSDPAYVAQGSNGVWNTTTWSEFRDDVAALSLQFAQHGLVPGARLGILARTSLGWETAQMAALTCGATVVGIDPYYPDALINELMAKLGVTGLVVEDAATFWRLSENAQNRFEFVVYLCSEAPRDKGNFPTLQKLRELRPGPAAWNPVAQPGAPALVAFSSGSTGNPKPIVYTHAQVVHACRSILKLYPELSPGTHLVCWLPLANLFQRMINFCATAKGAVSYIVEDPRHVMDAVLIANPEVFVAVPRFCEKLHAGMMQRMGEHSFLARLVERAIALGTELRLSQSGRSRIPPMKRILASLADRLVLARLRAVMGTRIKFIVSGSAPMPPWLLERFCGMGVPVLEAYGVSEDLVPVAANRLAERKTGTVGKPAGDNEVRIASDGEVQVRGYGVFLPALGENSASAGALTKDGFLATGDVGSFDEEGFLTLHGRRTEAFKSAQGRWVSLTQIEAVLRQLPAIEHAAVIRIPRDRLIAVLALSQPPGITPSSGTSPDAAELEHQLGVTLREHLALALSALPGAMHPVAFLVVGGGFTPASGEITTNLKLRRTAIAEKFAEPLRRLTDEIDGPTLVASALPLLKFV